MSLVMRKPTICICENKDADQLRGNHKADQRLCFHYKDCTTPLLPKSEISSFYQPSVVVQPGLCRTLSEPAKSGFLRTRLIFHTSLNMATSQSHSGGDQNLIINSIQSRASYE